MAKQNALSKAISKLESFPAPLRKKATSSILGFMVKFFGTAGIRVDEMNTERTVMTLKNRRKVQNHIGTVHAAAMSLLAESATGMLVAFNLPDDKLPLIKTMDFKFVKRAAAGELVAVAELSPEQLESIHNEDKGEVNVKVTITDVDGVEPILCDMVWAWIPKKKKAA